MDRPGSGFQETADKPDEGGFTTSIRTAEEEEFAIGDGEVNPFQSTGPVRVVMVKVFDFDHIKYLASEVPPRSRTAGASLIL